MSLEFQYWIILLIRTVGCFVDLFDHSTSITEYFISYDCIRYHGILNGLSKTLEYCVRQANIDESRDDYGVSDVSHRRFTFYELREMNISAEQVLQWSRSMDLVEMYLDYLDQTQTHESIENTTVHQCANLWFGSRCQYSLDIGSAFDFGYLISGELNARFPYDSEKAELPCFLGLKCLRNNETFCLDWREICNGEVDCYDEAEDEAFCHELEFNECGENQYRCRNGLCIPVDLSDERTLFCLDGSDSSIFGKESLLGNDDMQCFARHTLATYISNLYYPTGYCESVRELFRWTWMSNMKTSNHQCWQLLICLTHVRMHSDRLKCEEFLKTINISFYSNFCENITIFPENPIASNHVYLLYEPHNLSTYYSFGILLPAYICFNSDLCEHLQPTYIHKNLTCSPSTSLDIFKGVSTTKNKWKFISDQIRKEFHKCLVQLSDRNLFSGLSSNFSAYCCQNSSKCISRHRVMDGVIDCPFEDDEQAYEISCSITQRLSHRCSSEPYCRSPLLSFKLCSNQLLDFNELLFTEICDRTVHATQIELDGKNHTDETDCEFWNCTNPYTRCDGYWNCPDGEDEFNCPGKKSQCPRGTFECVSLHNLTMICLMAHRVLDGIQDCLGGSDEQDHCRRTFRLLDSYWSFTCRDEAKCLDSSSLCDKKSDCSTADDEIFCKTSRFSCQPPEFNSGNRIEKFICKNALVKRNVFHHSSWQVSPVPKHVSAKQRTLNQVIQRVHQRSSLCYRGISVRLRVRQNEYRFKCFCPVEYYGDRCQYQTKRISIIIAVQTPKPINSISFFAILIDEDDENQSIYSYQQNHDFSNSEFCRKVLQFNLIYPTHTQNLSKNYSIRIEIFDRLSMVFLASWHYTILYPFLPVYPLVVSMHIPIYTVTFIGSCFPSCEHGQCTKYLNENKFYCRCYAGWIGIRCDKKVTNPVCSPNSISIGYQMNRPICLCPAHLSGKRCMIKLSNIFQSIGDNQSLTNGTLNSEKYRAMDEYQKFDSFLYSLYIEFVFMRKKVPSYVLIHFAESYFNNYTNKIPKIQTVPLKVPPFQYSVTLGFKFAVDFLFVQTDGGIYFFNSQETRTNNYTKLKVSNDRLCPSVSNLLNPYLIRFPRIRRIKYYHQLCYNNSNLVCFEEELFICICTIDRRADCLNFDRHPKCSNPFYCLNGAQCFQDDANCPKKTVCVCNDCFFGDRCQFYARGIGLTLDDILRFQIRSGISFKKQSSPVILSAVLTIIVSAAIFINGILSLITFHGARPREVGTGIYLLASTVSSLIVASTLFAKYWFVVITHIHPSVSRSMMRFGCKTIEFLLKSMLAIDSWYNACVALERSVNIYVGINFNKKKSKLAAKWIIVLLPIVVGSTFVYELIYRDLSNDEETNRLWCILQHSKWIQDYSSAILLIHMTGPFLINLSSAVYIVMKTACQKSVALKQHTLKQHVVKQLDQHKNLIYSPIILAILSIPRLIISSLSGCIKSAEHHSIYTFGYFLSFTPSTLMFLIFVLPSEFYKEEFRKNMNQLYEKIRKKLFVRN